MISCILNSIKCQSIYKFRKQINGDLKKLQTGNGGMRETVRGQEEILVNNEYVHCLPYGDTFTGV